MKVINLIFGTLVSNAAAQDDPLADEFEAALVE